MIAVPDTPPIRVRHKCLAISPGRTWLLRSESVSFQRWRGANFFAEICAEDRRGISKMVAGAVFLSAVRSIDASTTNGAGGRSYAAPRARHPQTADLDQHNG